MGVRALGSNEAGRMSRICVRCALGSLTLNAVTPFGPTGRARAHPDEPAPDSIAEITQETMEAAVHAGQARYLSQTMDHSAHYASTWWMRDHEGWFKVTHRGLLQGLDAAAETMGPADAAVQAADHVTSNDSHDDSG